MSNTALQQLLQSRRDLWQGDQLPQNQATFSTGFDNLDKALGGGWPRGSLVELMHAQEGIGELTLLLPLLAARSQADDQQIALLNPPHPPYPPALSNAGIQLEQLLLLQSAEHTLWASEQLLRSALFDVVVLWQANTRNRDQRRLQLAAETGNAIAVCYRPSSAATLHSAAALRITLQAQRDGLQLHIIKSRRSGRQRELAISNKQLFLARQHT